jgi:hypothetical protein
MKELRVECRQVIYHIKLYIWRLIGLMSSRAMYARDWLDPDRRRAESGGAYSAESD